ncbi:basic phospholipase A2 taipoxin alpha chain-like [Montipora foliosa]|uniref:basic phospholipase A2 taipoxin alpha chain-like n=1 Tax=Montipora foliosa TaxID=591990 RepID=UPI0035F12807
MKMLVVKLLLGAFILAELQYGTMGRTGRWLLDFGLLIICKTRTNPLRFNGYGCYCGSGGKGQPVDSLDRCCQVHDECYGSVERRFGVGTLTTYVTPYFFNPLTCQCTTQLTDIQYALCLCDATAAACFRRSPYHAQFSGYNKERYC